MLLDIKNIDVLYDDFQVIWDVSINVKKAEMVALLGPNGSGKSTILNTISNLVQHKNGSIHFDNNLISKVPTHKRTALGISHVLERRRVFPHLTVMQNLLLGAWHPAAKKELNNSLNKIYKIFPKLEARSSQLARTMSGGEQQMLAIARGMMGLPKLLMVDEPFLGLSPIVMKDLIKIFKNIVNEGTSILFVEQNVRLALSMADRGYVLESGRLVIDGTSEDLIDNDKVTKVFLGN
ncbi:MAG: ABC transporter ATP-binding protein [Thiotrichales bacterium]|jgi:branched-chain amino acid transport system ATP-binding protein|nr:ABC transporter ATP-binding protein [Thiotrichales bacterium]MDB3982053.1 ABC transporter ATP-binding protein [Candidatus Pelagibacter sp.]|tara:strand:- start:540 stop:1247 length:708 start_codon:yes stop_codon:yes gene_type:complete